MGDSLPRRPTRNAGAYESFVAQAVEDGRTVSGQYMQIADAQWTQYGSGIVIRRGNGEFVTFLDATGGGQALNFPGGLQ